MIKEEVAVQMSGPAWDRGRGERLWGPKEGGGMGMERRKPWDWVVTGSVGGERQRGL